MKPSLSNLHVLSVLSFAVWLYTLRLQQPVISWSAFLALLALTSWTFTAMFQLSRSKLGPRYARRNLALAIFFTIFFGGLGILLWPILVRTEIRKLEAT